MTCSDWSATTELSFDSIADRATVEQLVRGSWPQLSYLRLTGSVLGEDAMTDERKLACTKDSALVMSGRGWGCNCGHCRRTGLRNADQAESRPKPAGQSMHPLSDADASASD